MRADALTQPSPTGEGANTKNGNPWVTVLLLSRHPAFLYLLFLNHVIRL
ncbi:hypothetical protein HMPREF1619_01889 [Klebsiella pneumoniae 909957]|nr:hypothetical protein HMPREF1619_01889 [Klebsiella pneumoniae 909957]